MTHLYLIRHAEYLSSDETPDGGLSSAGHWQAERLRERLGRTREIAPDVLIASPLPRAVQTAGYLAPIFGLPVLVEGEVEEWRNVSPDGTLITDKLRAAAPDQRPFVEPYPGGEDWSAFMSRAVHALNRLTREHAGGSIVVVCHGGVIEASFVFFAGLSPFRIPPLLIDADYTSLTHWQKIPGVTLDRWRLNSFNDTAHLRAQAW